jgi:hypothetical protein
MSGLLQSSSAASALWAWAAQQEIFLVGLGAPPSRGVGVSAALLQRPSSRSKTARRNAAGTCLSRRRLYSDATLRLPGLGVGLRRVTRPSSGARLCRPRLVFARTPSLELDERSTEVLLGGERIVGVAAQREIVRRVRAAMRKGLQVVELEAVSLSAPLSRGVGVRAAPFVALEDGAADRGGDVSTALARVLGFHFRPPGVGVGSRVLGFGLGARFLCRLTLSGRATYVY